MRNKKDSYIFELAAIMETRITKSKLPKTQAYPIKSSFLLSVLLKSKFDQALIDSIQYSPVQHPHHLFGAHYKGKKAKAFALPGTLDITINAVATAEVKQISTLLQFAIQKHFTEWLNKLEENKLNWCDESRGFHVWYKDNTIKIDQ